MKLYSVEGNQDGLVLVTHKLQDAIVKAYDYAEVELTKEEAKHSKKTLRNTGMLTISCGSDAASVNVWES